MRKCKGCDLLAAWPSLGLFTFDFRTEKKIIAFPFSFISTEIFAYLC